MENRGNKIKICSSSFMYNTMQDYKDKVIIIDTRNNQLYDKSHIKGSISLNVERVSKYLSDKEISSVKELTMYHLNDILQESESLKFSKIKRCFCFIIAGNQRLPGEIDELLKRDYNADLEYDDDFLIDSQALSNTITSALLDSNPEKDSLLNSLHFTDCLIKESVRETHLLIDGMSQFFTYYPFLNNCLVSEFPKGSFKHCNDIYNSRLFLSAFDTISDAKIVKEIKITHIINATTEKECENVHQSFISYLRINLLDEEDKEIYKHFSEAYKFIDNALSSDDKNIVLVHCAQGKSRSATIIIMYLMKKFGWNFEKAQQFVKRKRNAVMPNHGFCDQLAAFEKNDFDFEKLNETMNK